MNYIDLFKASFILLFVGGYSALAVLLLGRAMLNTASVLARVPAGRRSGTSRKYRR
jgi:hypothetical protein